MDGSHTHMAGKETRPRRFLRFFKSRRAAVALEFAFIAPFLFVLIFFIIWTGYAFVMGQALSSATQKASRQIATGSVQAAQMTKDQFRTNVVCAQLPVMFTCSNVIVNVQTVPTNDSSYPNEYYSFVNSTQTGLVTPALDNSTTSFCPGNAQSYVYVQILYPVSIFLPFVTRLAGLTTFQGQSTLLISSTATFLNEPFSAPVAGC